MKKSKTVGVGENRHHIGLATWRIVAVYLSIFDLFAVNAAYFIALWLRFDCRYSSIPRDYLAAWLRFSLIYSVFCILVFWILRLYNSVWRFASYNEFARVVASSVITSVFHVVFTVLLIKRMPIAYYIFGMFAQLALVMGVRFAYRVILTQRRRYRNRDRATRVMLIGAGSAGEMILRDLNRAKELNDRVCCIIDDDPNKWNRRIDGVLIVGGRDSILASVEKYQIEKIYLAIPSATAEQRRDILNICKETGCELKNLPGMYQFVLGTAVTAGQMKDVAVEDLLGRDPIKVNMDKIYEDISGKVILVTGGGGSIGSELCRQIAGHHPKQLIVLDVYENNAYAIQLELRDKYPNLNLVVLIGSVRDSRKLDQVFSKYRPDIVYHAAAHKHVPLMEDSPCEAIKDNSIGTYKTAYAAAVYGCKRFVLISTDKAVNPTNIMGASKRLCEMVIQSFDRKIKEGKADQLPPLYTHAEEYGNTCGHSSTKRFPSMPPRPVTEFVAVRFGNVLGSNGSVIPIFKEQIAKGGPVTVTHPEINRFFMTIPEAVSLVMQAGTYAHGGEIFVLDMGEPVKIDMLARNLIKLSGLKPDEDIQIVYTGLRPGEKLYEEKLMSEEGMKTTPNKLIHIGSPIPFDTDQFLQQIQMLMSAAYDEREDIRQLVARVVTTYRLAETAEERAQADAPADSVPVGV